MKCPRCHIELAGEPMYCSECGYHIKSGDPVPFPTSSPGFSTEEDLTASSGAEGALKPPSGFRRTLSTELVARQSELRTLVRLSALIESRTYKPGEVMIHQGEMKRDLIFLTEGVVEISKKEKDGDFILNEIEPPYILGDIAFLSGIPRTATAVAKTEVKTFVMKYEDLRDLFKNLPAWVHPLLTSFASGIKSLHHRAIRLERKILELKGQISDRT